MRSKTKHEYRPRIRKMLRDILSNYGWENRQDRGDRWEPRYKRRNYELQIEFNKRNFTITEVEHPVFTEGWSMRNYPLSKAGVKSGLGSIGIRVKS